jgi:hypothetical protein
VAIARRCWCWLGGRDSAVAEFFFLGCSGEGRPGERQDEEEPRNPCVFNVPELFAPRRSKHLELEMRWRGGTRSRRRNSQALQVACCPALTEISTVKVI